VRPRYRRLGWVAKIRSRSKCIWSSLTASIPSEEEEEEDGVSVIVSVSRRVYSSETQTRAPKREKRPEILILSAKPKM